MSKDSRSGHDSSMYDNNMSESSDSSASTASSCSSSQLTSDSTDGQLSSPPENPPATADRHDNIMCYKINVIHTTRLNSKAKSKRKRKEKKTNT